MELNKPVIIATLGLAAIGAYKHYTNPAVTLTPIFVGSFIFMLSLSVLDLFGGNASKLASALAMVALINGVLTDVDLSKLTQAGGQAGKPPLPNTNVPIPGGTGHTP